MLHLRFFLSSPGDVADEREFAQQVIEQELPKDPLLGGELTCQVVRYDDAVAPSPMPATMAPQEAVDTYLPQPSECDVVVVILWSRLGTRLPADKFHRPDGSAYLSGTEWEYEDAINASPQPHVLVYWRNAEVKLTANDKDFDEKTEQMRKVRQFLGRFRNADGTLKAGYAEYENPQRFRDRLRNDLRAYVRRRLVQATAPALASHASHQPPYGAIARALAAGDLIPFIGPGVLASGRDSEAHWDPSAPKFLPSSVELARFLADEAHLPSEVEREHLAEVASFYEVVEQRDTLRERLRQIFGSKSIAEAVIPPIYSVLAEVKRPLLIITTNYDTLLERAFLAKVRPYDLVVYPPSRKDLANAVLWWPHGAREPGTPEPNKLDIDLSKTTTTVIFKMHGTIQPETDRWDGTVITEGDYVEFLSRVGGQSAIPSAFSNWLLDRSVLFLGFGLRDWSSRTILRSLKWHTSPDEDEALSWAIEAHVSEAELLLWRKRRVVPFEVALDKFAGELRQRITP
jgi:hypothetical protein